MVLFIKLFSVSTLLYLLIGSRYIIESTTLSNMGIYVVSGLIMLFAFVNEAISFLGLEGMFNKLALRVLGSVATVSAASVNLLLPKLAFIEYNYLDYVPFRFGFKIHRNWSQSELLSYIDRLLNEAHIPTNALSYDFKVNLIQKSGSVQELNNNLLYSLNQVASKQASIFDWLTSPYVVVPVVMVSAVVIAYYSYQNTQTIYGLFHNVRSLWKSDAAAATVEKKTLEVIRADQQAISTISTKLTDVTHIVEQHSQLLENIGNITFNLSEGEVKAIKAVLLAIQNGTFRCPGGGHH